jgi:LmbE family N-acetylglucosaminyl deacetylase
MMHFRLHRLSFGAFLLLAGLGVRASAAPELGAVALHQALLDVGTDLRLMCVAAHPDDEDGASLAMYRKKWGYKTYAVLATRGEGGQNEIGPELYEKLAVLRTHEMARASAITGAELHFLNLPEFGYSKSREETFALWGEDVALERMVRKIRELRPDVIITHHPPTGAHGHHQAIGKSLQDAFDAAADPAVFPEHEAEGLEPWQASRLYVRSFQGGSDGAVNDFSELDPARGYTYAQIAAQALGEHETQGMAFFIDRFLTSRSSAFYTLAKEAKGSAAVSDGLPAPGGPLFEGLRDRVTPEARRLSEEGRSATREALRDAALKHLAEVNPADRRAWARANRLAAVALDLRLTARIDDDEAVPGQAVTLSVEARDYAERDAGEIAFRLEPAPWMPVPRPADVPETFASDGFANTTFRVEIPANQPPTIPHHAYVFDDTFLVPQLTVAATVQANGRSIELRAPVYVDIAPPVSVAFIGGPYLIQSGMQERAEFKALITNHTPGGVDTTLLIDAPPGIVLEQTDFTVSLAREGDQKVVLVPASIAPGIAPGDYPLSAEARTGSAVNEQRELARAVELAVPEGKRVGVVASYDDTYVTTLQRLGVPHELIEIDDLAPERLDRFTTIILDIRAYLVRPDVVASNRALLDYVHRGGTLIVNYQKTMEWDSALAPYDLQLGRGRVTREDAPVTVLVPEHPLFNTPNRIVPSDWDGWRQERGLYFPGRWDRSAYTALVSMADPGEAPQDGSCLIASYGDGTYFYTALGWYRQLQELNPGALRIFANMLAL